jgi:hypothetical protein
MKMAGVSFDSPSAGGGVCNRSVFSVCGGAFVFAARSCHVETPVIGKIRRMAQKI